jgi:hypothetical protein
VRAKVLKKMLPWELGYTLDGCERIDLLNIKVPVFVLIKT